MKKNTYIPPYPERNPLPPQQFVKVPPFLNFWCNEVVPLIYDDTLSYIELLNKITHYVNNLIADDKHIIENINAVAKHFVELKNYVDNYFNEYQNRAMISYEDLITHDNYIELLPNADDCLINNIYRMTFTNDEYTANTITSNLPNVEWGEENEYIGMLYNYDNFVTKADKDNGLDNVQFFIYLNTTTSEFEWYYRIKSNETTTTTTETLNGEVVEVTRTSTSWGEWYNVLETLNASIQKAVDDLQAQIDELNEDVTNINDELADIETSITSINNEITELMADVSTNTGDITQLKTDVKTNAEDISNTNSQLDDVKTNVANNTTAINNNATNISNNQSAIEDLQTNVSNLTTNAQNLQTQITNNLNAIKDLETNYSNLQTAVNDIKSSYLPLTGGTLTGDLVLEGSDLRVDGILTVNEKATFNSTVDFTDSVDLNGNVITGVDEIYSEWVYTNTICSKTNGLQIINLNSKGVVLDAGYAVYTGKLTPTEDNELTSKQYVVGLIATSSSSISDLQTNVSNLTTNAQNLQTQITNNLNAIKDLETNYSNLQSAIKDLETNYSNLQTKVDGLEDSVLSALLQNSVPILNCTLVNVSESEDYKRDIYLKIDSGVASTLEGYIKAPFILNVTKNEYGAFPDLTDDVSSIYYQYADDTYYQCQCYDYNGNNITFSQLAIGSLYSAQMFNIINYSNESTEIAIPFITIH